MGKFDGILLVSDLDGTLLTNDKRLSEENREAIDRFVEGGGIFTFATGRTTYGMRVVLEQYTPATLIECLNGGGIYDPKTGECLWALQLDDSVEELTAFVRAEFPNVGIELCGLYESWCLHKTFLSEFYREYEKLPCLNVSHRGDADPLVKIYLYSEADSQQALADALNAHPLAKRFELVRSGPELYEIMPKDAKKGKGLLRLADMLGIPREKTVAIGDNDNDLSMIEMAGIGVAVANATPKAKAVADLVLNVTNDQHAIAVLIDKLDKAVLSKV